MLVLNLSPDPNYSPAWAKQGYALLHGPLVAPECAKSKITGIFYQDKHRTQISAILKTILQVEPEWFLFKTGLAHVPVLPGYGVQHLILPIRSAKHLTFGSRKKLSLNPQTLDFRMRSMDPAEAIIAAVRYAQPETAGVFCACGCGQSLAHKRADALYFSPTCRKRSSRARQA